MLKREIPSQQIEGEMGSGQTTLIFLQRSLKTSHARVFQLKLLLFHQHKTNNKDIR